MDPTLQQMLSILQSGGQQAPPQNSALGVPGGGSLAQPESSPQMGMGAMSPGQTGMGQNPYQFLGQQPPMQQGMLG
jgi:hypothetical protein